MSVPKNDSDCKVAVYYFPDYHVDSRNEQVHGKGWSEWEHVQNAKPRCEDHDQPKVPLWGYGDEADPAVMAKKIGAAADHGIDAFLFDWYWYDNKPYLHRALEEGFMRADNCDRLKFSLMWANHDWCNIHPAGASRDGDTVVFPSKVHRDIWDNMTDYIVAKYFKHPSYWLIDGKPVFQIYELFNLIASLGGSDNCRQALSEFREKTRAAGFEGLHLNAIVSDLQVLPGEKSCSDPEQMPDLFHFDSITSYVWVHHIKLAQFPMTDYVDVMKPMVAMWPELAEKYGLPYYPNVTMGWDSSPRTDQNVEFVDSGYPFCAGMKNNTPEHFRQALVHARDYINSSDLKNRILTINAWNEWTEGSYIEPDVQAGMGYLEAIRDVFQKDDGSKISGRLESRPVGKNSSLDDRRLKTSASEYGR